ncbi:RagB/SusD family nutrient uptake outer membrane protein [Sphingobacterium faecale]|uniref:RagB/SusD family nutrient uptake outer membrane protein n=1 Tax=Sphingobacterium faecale TaxID=2803775 RepID=A0ABS1R458_9SPHI|nr:RagB/SusD family nutrient uptake outer membrane protein [Sphingobacterium faecale]MBL1409498.1 RagB/SusD family nutrient uptake outer membrane protein [Sphingobacterium faecale]
MKRYIITCIVVACSLAVMSCKKWLDVSSDTEIGSEQQFNDITGFRDAVIGVYIKMAKPNMYGQEMTWRTVEFLSQQYAVIAQAPDVNVPLYAWDSAPLPSKRENIWLATYATIANVNQILRYQEKNRAVFGVYPITDSLIRGEMLGLRAFLHFDMMRLYGKGNLAERPELLDKLTIPYVTTFSRLPTEQKAYRETLAMMKKDVEEAIMYLECDPLSRKRDSQYWNAELANGFISTQALATMMPNRRIRMNYWAAKALYTRILMWEGTKESKAMALEIALEIIGEANSNGLGRGLGAYYTWTNPGAVDGEFFEADLAFVNEQLFTLHVEKFLEIQESAEAKRNWFSSASPGNQYSSVFLTDDRRKTVFESGTNLISVDWRAIKCLFPDGATRSNWTIAKFYNTKDSRASYSKRMPLIRITELYYIAAEALLEQGATYDKDKALALLNKVRNQRNIPVSSNLENSLSDDEIRMEITKEYRKEFIAEGQLFYYYKRLGHRNILGYGKEMTDVEYQMPMPDNEVNNGGLREN